jgi:protease I
MAGRLDGRGVVVLLAEGFEDLEFWVTVMRLQEEGAQVTVAGLTTQPVHGKNRLEATADVEVDAVSADTVDAVVVPGGWAPTSSAATTRSPTWSPRPTIRARSLA